MAISVDPLTDVIYIPKADLTLIQASPEVRELNMNSFHLWLKDWEDDEEAIPRPRTHNHNTEVSLAGLTYARIIEILSPYTVEFEDGQYTVNCVGANHNISDKKVANQVSLIVNNAAGLIGNDQIEYSSFGGGVTVDLDNVFGTATDGTIFPAGTPQTPSDNFTDALLIANTRGFTKLFIIGDAAIDSTHDFDNFEIIGQSINKSLLTINTTASTEGCEFQEATITGVLDGQNYIKNCTVVDLEYVNGSILNCGLIGDITLAGGSDATIADCYTVDQDDPPVIDMGGTGQSLAMPNYSGLASIKNLSDATQNVGIGLDAGMITLESTISAGTIIIAGNGMLTNNSTGTAIVNTEGLTNTSAIAESAWNALAHHIHYDATSGNSGTIWPVGSQSHPVNNLTDALAICVAHGKKGIVFTGTLVIDQPLVGYTVKGTSSVLTEIAVVSGVDVSRTQFELCVVTGTAVNSSNMQGIDALFNDFYGFDGILIGGGVKGTLQVKSGGTLITKQIAFASNADIIDANGAVACSVDFVGTFTLSNLTGGGFLQAGGYFGTITVDSSCNGGFGVLLGTVQLVDNATQITWLNEGSISRESIDATIWTGANGLEVMSDLAFVKKIEGGRWVISAGQMVFYDDDNITEVARFDLTYDANQNPIERTRV